MSLTEPDTAVAFDVSTSDDGNGQPQSNGHWSVGVDEWESIAWDDAAPKRLRRLNSNSELREVADALARMLRPAEKRCIKGIARGDLPHPARLLPVAVLDQQDAKDVSAHCRRLRKSLMAVLPSWRRKPSARISRLAEACFSPAGGTVEEILTAGWGLIAAASHLTDDALSQLWRSVLRSAQSAVQEFQHLAEPGRECTVTDSSANLQLAELHLMAGLIFRYIIGAPQLAQRGVEWANSLLEAATDTDGVPHGAWQPTMSTGILAALRLAWLDDWWAGERLLPRSFRQRLKRLLKQVVAMNALPEHGDLLLWGLRSLGAKGTLLAVRSLDSMGSRQAVGIPGNPAAHSAWGSFGILRNRWGAGSDICTVGYAEDECRVEIETAGKYLASGAWSLDVSAAGQPISFTDDWSLMCWSSDEDGDYLEIGRDAQGVSLIRQFFLSRTDCFLYLADSIRAEFGPVTYRSSIPLESGWKSEQDGLTREFALTHKRTRLRIFPLSLPQNVADGANGRIDASDGRLQLAAESPLPGVTSAVLLNWSPSLRKAAVDWNLLTVAEAGRRLDPGEAFGSRIRIGAEQLVFFHSLTPATLARTVLGHHTPYESVIARFVNGECKPLLNVEA